MTIYKPLLKLLETPLHLHRHLSKAERIAWHIINSYYNLLAAIEARAALHEIKRKPEGTLQLKYATTDELKQLLIKKGATPIMEIHENNEATYPWTHHLLKLQKTTITLSTRYKITRHDYIHWKPLYHIASTFADKEEFKRLKKRENSSSAPASA